jgi:hypothetical protein
MVIPSVRAGISDAHVLVRRRGALACAPPVLRISLTAEAYASGGIADALSTEGDATAAAAVVRSPGFARSQ